MVTAAQNLVWHLLLTTALINHNIDQDRSVRFPANLPLQRRKSVFVFTQAESEPVWDLMFEKRDKGYETQTSAAFHYLDFAVCVKLVCVAVAAVPALLTVPVESKVSTGQHGAARC